MHTHALQRILLAVSLLGFASSPSEAREDDEALAKPEPPAPPTGTPAPADGDARPQTQNEHQRQDKPHGHHRKSGVNKRVRSREKQLRALIRDLEIVQDRVLDAVRDVRRQAARFRGDRQAPATDDAAASKAGAPAEPALDDAHGGQAAPADDRPREPSSARRVLRKRA
jgi:hypothetical protein